MELWNENTPHDFFIQKGLAGHVYSRAADKEKLPELAREWRFYWYQNSLIMDEMHRLGRELDARSMSVVVLKGAAWIDTIYEDRGERCMSDLDLFVTREGEATLREFLQVQGYEEYPGDHFEASEFATVFRRLVDGAPVFVDLHIGKIFTDETKNVGWETEEFAPGLRRLKKEEALVHFAGHVAFQNAFIRLDLVMDLDRFLRKFSNDLDWSRIELLSRRWKKRTALQAVLWLAGKVFASPVPSGIVTSRSHVLFPVLFPREYLLHSEQHRVRYLILKHLMKDSVLEAWKTDWKWIRHTLRFR